MPSRLHLLMKMFAISGKNLSELVHVDSSLISKWRSGKRVLKPDSCYVETMVDHIIELDKPNNYINICKLLANDYEKVFSSSEEELSEKLSVWLTSSSTLSKKKSKFDELKDMDSVELCIFYKLQGNEGRRQAVRFLMNYAISHSPELEVLSYTEEEASWFYEDAAFSKEWSKKNYWLLKHGNLIKVIHPVDRKYENMALSMFRWIPLHMTGKTQAFYIPQYTEEAMNFTIFLIPHQLVVFSMSSKIYGEDVDTYITNNPAFLESMKDTMSDFFDRCVPIFSRYKYKKNVDFINDIIGILEAKKTKYLYCSTPLFMPLSESLIKEILAYNHIPKAQIPKYTDLYCIISKLCIRSLNRYFINIDRIKRHLNKDSVVLNSFSFMMGKTISAPGNLFNKILKESIDNVKSVDMIEAGITDSNFLLDLGNINILAQKNTYVNFFSADLETPLSLVTKELTVITGVFQKLENIWEDIPRINRNKAYVCNQLQELLNEAEGEK